MMPDRPYFDGHNDFLLRLFSAPDRREEMWLTRGGGGHLDLPRMREGGFVGGLFAIFVPPEPNEVGADFMATMKIPPYDVPLPPMTRFSWSQGVALAMAGHMHWMERNAPDDFAICRSTADIGAAMASGKIAGVMHMEGAEAIGPNLDTLYLFHEMGLRSLGPVWSRPTIFGHGVPMRFPGTPDTGPGLTDLGKDLIRLCDELGILIDLAHLNQAGVDDVARLSHRPLVATHSNAHAICATTRNLTDRQLGQIRDSGGMVGLNYATFFLPQDGISDVAMGFDPMLRHLDYLIEALGEDHVGLGSDFDGATVVDALKDVAGIPAFFDAMAAHGYDEALIRKLGCDNWLACFDRSWTA